VGTVAATTAAPSVANIADYLFEALAGSGLNGREREQLALYALTRRQGLIPRRGVYALK